MKKVKTPQGYYCYMRTGFSDEKVFKEIFLDKIYCKKSIGFDVLQGETWIDLGANCGYFSQFALEIGANVFALDADFENEIIIQKLKSYENFIGYEMAAVVPDSYKQDFVSFYKRKDKMTWKSSLFRTANAEKVKVKTIRMSDLLKKFEVEICLKADIEGAEIPILKEMKDFSKIKKMAFEWSFDKEPRVSVLKTVIEKLKSNFKTVYCPQKLDGIHQTWQGKANQFALIYCIK